MNHRPLTADEILWDIEQEHLDEAGFCVELREGALDAPHYVLHEVESGPERRLFAHLDALRRGGPLTAEWISSTVFDDPDSDVELVEAAALAVLPEADAKLRGRLVDTLEHGASDAQREGILGALSLGVCSAVDDRMSAELQVGLAIVTPPSLRARLHVLAARGVPIDPWLPPLLSSADPALATTAALLVRRSRDPGLHALLAPLAQAEDPHLRCAVLESALVHQIPGAWSSALYWAFCPGESPFRRDALAWVALFGDTKAHDRLLAFIDDPKHQRDVLWAMGFCGRIAAVDRCVEFLDDPELAPLAGEAISSIAGLSLADRRYALAAPEPSEDAALPSLEDDDLDADLVPDSEDALAYPNPSTVRQWWTEARPRFDPALRYLGGEILDRSVLLRALRHAPMRRRHLLAFELEMRTHGAVLIDTRAWCWRQREQLQVADQLSTTLDLQRGLA